VDDLQWSDIRICICLCTYIHVCVCVCVYIYIYIYIYIYPGQIDGLQKSLSKTEDINKNLNSELERRLRDLETLRSSLIEEQEAGVQARLELETMKVCVYM
jgi:hypothetical protein